MRILAFVLALLLLAGSVDPTRGWLIALVVLTGLSAFRPRFGLGLNARLAFDVRLASFVFALLFLAGTIDPTRDWLIALSAVTGVAAFMPHIFGLDLFGNHHYRRGGAWRWKHSFGDWPDRLDREWENWERRMDRRWARDARHGDRGEWS